MNNEQPDADLAMTLKSMRPARSELDAREVFFQAGFESCRSQSEARRSANWAALAAAAVMASMVTVPLSYRAGQVAQSNTMSIDTNRELTAPSPSATQSLAPLQPRVVAVNKRNSESVVSDRNVSPVAGDDPWRSVRPTNAVAGQIAQWLAWDQLAESKQLDLRAETVLTVSHSALVSRHDVKESWSEFPRLIPKASGGLQNSADLLHQDNTSTPPLAVGQLRQLALQLESFQ